MTSLPTNRRRDWLALYVLCLGMLMIVLDATVVNPALPVLKESLGFSDGGLTWVVNAYLIPFGGLLMLSGRIGDVIGQRNDPGRQSGHPGNAGHLRRRQDDARARRRRRPAAGPHRRQATAVASTTIAAAIR